MFFISKNGPSKPCLYGMVIVMLAGNSSCKEKRIADLNKKQVNKPKVNQAIAQRTHKEAALDTQQSKAHVETTIQTTKEPHVNPHKEQKDKEQKDKEQKDKEQKKQKERNNFLTHYSTKRAKKYQELAREHQNNHDE